MRTIHAPRPRRPAPGWARTPGARRGEAGERVVRAALAAALDDRYVLVHGLYIPAGESSWHSSQIQEEEIAALECDYLALGHVHRYWDVSSGSVTASYSGSATQDRIPGVNLVRLDEGFGVRLERRLLATVPNTLCRYRALIHG